MASVCYACGVKPVVGNNVSHANNRTRRRWLPNLKKVRVKVGGSAQTVRLCTRCIRTGKYAKVA
ncbi:MAG: 50S ribosomal protein L28 [Pseudomonadota bacterium]